MTEEKKETLLELISQLDNHISELLHKIEDDENISHDTYKELDDFVYDKIFSICSELKTEVHYS